MSKLSGAASSKMSKEYIDFNWFYRNGSARNSCWRALAQQNKVFFFSEWRYEGQMLKSSNAGGCFHCIVWWYIIYIRTSTYVMWILYKSAHTHTHTHTHIAQRLHQQQFNSNLYYTHTNKYTHTKAKCQDDGGDSTRSSAIAYKNPQPSTNTRN